MPENDIKYGGYLSYRHLRIIGWVCLVIAQIGVVLNLEAKLAPDAAQAVEIWNMVIAIFAGLPVPLFLIANLSIVLQKRGDFKSLFIKFGGMALGMYFLANFLVFHFGFRSMHAINQAITWADTAELFGMMLPLFGKTGYTMNIFIDLLLVVLMFYFTNYVPRAKVFEGKRIILFRLLILLPIAYEVLGVIVKYNIGMVEWSIWSPIFFLLPSKPPVIMGAFVVIVLGLKLSEFFYLRRPGKTPEMFERHITTNAHGFKISIFIAIVCFVAAIIDVLLVFGMTILAAAELTSLYPTATSDELGALLLARLDVFSAIGFGESVGLILVVPLILLFSYTKKHKNPKIDLLIPAVGIAFIGIVLVEGTFQVITLNLPTAIAKLKEAMNQWLGMEETPPASALRIATNFLTNIRL